MAIRWDREYQWKWTRACHCLGRFSRVVHHVMAWSSIVIKWCSRRRTPQCTHCWSSAPVISYIFNFFFFAFIILTIYPLLYFKQCVERASIDGVGRSQVACLPFLGTVLSSCSSCNGAIKHQVKWWCQLRRWGTSQVAIFLIHMSLLYAQYPILTDVNQIWIGSINWSGRVPVIVLSFLRCTSCNGVIKYRYQVMVQEAHASMYALLVKRACHFVFFNFFVFLLS